MMRPTLLRSVSRAAALLLVGVTACARQPGPRRETADTLLTGDSLVAALHALGRSFGTSRDGLEGRLGTPARIETETVPNRHVEGALDTAIALWYGDGVFGLLRSGATGQEFLVGAEMWGRADLPGGMRLGATARDWTEAALGAPAERRAEGDTTTLVYFWPPEGAEEAVRLRFVRDTLRIIGWSFYVD